MHHRGSHAVQFYDKEQVIQQAVAQYFMRDARAGDRLIMVSRPHTFTAVSEHLTSGHHGPAIPLESVLFIDAEMALSQSMNGETLDTSRAERLFKHVLSQISPGDAQSSIRLYGEAVDVLCQRGRHAAALQFEGIASVLLDLEPRLSILCSYASDRFNDDANAAHFRAVCQKHTHVLRHSGLETPPPLRLLTHDTPSLGNVYIIDDNTKILAALKRMLTSSSRSVRTFESAEAFLSELDNLEGGCLVVDVQLQGMSGLELLHRLANARVSWPIIVMSGMHDKNIERKALTLGARAFLRKPFEPQALLDALAQCEGNHHH